MKQVLSSLVIAFSMYSKIPMPKTEWSKDNMKYIMCFFPLIGGVIGATVFLWSFADQVIPMSQIFKTVIMVLIPVFITGGIHVDGLLDTADALSSYQPMERKLEILKDPNSGAFAIITCVSYFLLSFGIWYEASSTVIPVLSFSFVLSRALSGLSIVTFPLAKNTGLATTFSDGARKKITALVMVAYILISISGLVFLDWILGLFSMAGAFLVFLYYRYMSEKKFGGITGDLAGFFLQICELVMVIFVVVGDKICG